eukprot:TRINITY_DN15850_c0_g1_i1.p1 TRINITY_DN15850_c0_g1~~TRINITY_DN15850_c0_g1_i1.p1  ORF type:complete len:540 (+),score=87.42 TRINITY_DN15850_c0_g1_i1:95-1714(+)
MKIRQVMRTAAIIWFKTDLRLHDHEPIAKALQTTKGSVVPVYCFDPRHFRKTHYFGFPRSSPQKTRFLVESVKDLRESFQKLGSDLTVRVGNPEDVIPKLIDELSQENISVEGVYSHQEVCDEELIVEKRLVQRLKTKNIPLKTYWGGQTMHHIDDLPFEPKGKGSEVLNIFTRFRHSIEGSDHDVRKPFNAPSKKDLTPLQLKFDRGSIPTIRELIKLGGDDNLSHWISHAKKFNYDFETCKKLDIDKNQVPKTKFVPMYFPGGETKALQRMNYYIWDSNLIQTYKDTRNGLLGMDYSSKWSPWLALGCISARLIYHEIRRYEEQKIANQSTAHLIFELLWRDYFRYLMIKYGNQIFHLEGLAKYQGTNKIKKWHVDRDYFQKWCDGLTGLTFVDANMLEINTTGFMSNRGRQNVASFLTKDLSIDWRMGAEFFESILLDYDTCSNYGNWLYVAGVGTDPREDRYFNVIKQAMMYDPKHEYVRYWVPKFDSVDYPKPIVTVKYHVTPKQADSGGPKPKPIRIRGGRGKPRIQNAYNMR